MRIVIYDDFDSEFELEYSLVDSEESYISNRLIYGNSKIIDVDIIDKDSVEEKEEIIFNNEIDKPDEHISYKKNIDSKKVFSKKSSRDFREYENSLSRSENKLDNNHKNSEEDFNNSNIDKLKNKFKEECKNNKIRKKVNDITGKIIIISKLDNINGTIISNARINLYKINGVSPKLVDSKLSDNDGKVVFDNLPEGSYRAIAIVDRKYFEKPVYIDWNEVTISEDIREEEIIVINKVRVNSRY